MSKTFAHDLTLRDSDLDDIGGLLVDPQRLGRSRLRQRGAGGGPVDVRTLGAGGARAHPDPGDSRAPVGVRRLAACAPAGRRCSCMGTSTCSRFPIRVRGRAIRSNRISATGGCTHVAPRT